MKNLIKHVANGRSIEEESGIHKKNTKKQKKFKDTPNKETLKYKEKSNKISSKRTFNKIF